MLALVRWLSSIFSLCSNIKGKSALLQIGLNCVKGLGTGFYISTADSASDMCDMSFNEHLLKKELGECCGSPNTLMLKCV